MSTKITGSEQPTFASEQLSPISNRGYGQNGFGGASSDLPGQNTKSGYLPSPGDPVNDQLRRIKADPLPTAFGQRKR